MTMADENTEERKDLTTTGSLHENDEGRARGKTQQVDVQKGRQKDDSKE